MSAVMASFESLVSLRDRKCIDWLRVGLEAWFVKVRPCVHALFLDADQNTLRTVSPAFRADKIFQSES